MKRPILFLAARLCHLAEASSVKKSAEGLKAGFVAAGNPARIPVRYEGSLPDLFREGPRAVAQGHRRPPPEKAPLHRIPDTSGVLR